MGDYVVNFSLKDFQNGIAKGLYTLPQAYCPYISTNRANYRKLEVMHEKKNNDIVKSFSELRKRINKQYFRNVYPLQSRILDFSQQSFPAYRFLLPEVISDDWLAMVGWHKFNRDHVLHQPLTAYIVQKLLKEPQFSVNKTLLEICIDEILKWDKTAYIRNYLIEIGVKESDPWLKDSRDSWNSLFLETACLAAIFHDIGYPWQYVNHLSGMLEHAENHFYSPTANAEELVKIYGERLLFCPLNGYKLHDCNAPGTWYNHLINLISNALRKTHGFPGAIGFLYLNDALRNYPSDNTHPIKQFCVEWAAMAIMMHDMTKIYWGNGTSPENPHLQLKFDTDPLSCVIALADIIEDFSRPQAHFVENDEHVEINYRKEQECDCTKLEILPNNVMKIDYFTQNVNQCMTKKLYLPKEHRNYFDSKYKYLDLSAAGIKTVEMDAQICKIKRR